MPIKSFHLLLFIFILCKVNAQKVKQAEKETLPVIVTQPYLDSTRSLTQGNSKMNAAYLTLTYNFNNIDSVEWIYDEVKVPRGEAPVKTYYCAISGYIYYCGLQVNSKKERRIIFSVWDNKYGKNNKNQSSDSIRPKLISVGKDVITERFGNEGSGIHTHYKYDWHEDSVYKFLIHTVPDSILKTTTVTLFVEINNQWKMIAKIKRPQCIGYEKGAMSFLEDFNGKDDEHRRSASFQNQWVRKVSGEWVEVTKAFYTLPFGDKNRKIKDYGCGLSSSHGFMLTSGG
ncbi:MAG: DUF3472 domain-containing protein [Ginsengibacter sp.]